MTSENHADGSPVHPSNLRTQEAIAAPSFRAAASYLPPDEAEEAPPDDEPLTPEMILARARIGDDSVVPQLSVLLDQNPQVWKAHDLTKATEQAWIDHICNGNLLWAQSLRRQVEQMRSDLAGPKATLQEQMLAAWVIVCWLAAQSASLVEGAVFDERPKIAQLRMQRSASANRNLLNAHKTLAQVRRLIKGLKIEITHKAAPVSTPGSTEAAEELLRTAQKAAAAEDYAAEGDAANDRLNQYMDDETQQEMTDQLS